MVRSLFSRDLFAELDRLQREVQQAFELTPSIRGFGRSGFPALNVGTTPGSVEIYAFAPGLDPSSIDLSIERGVLTLSGERPNDLPKEDTQAATHINERVSGAYRRVVSLSDDVDPESATASYRDGVLHISVKRRAAAQPRRIDIH